MELIDWIFILLTPLVGAYIVIDAMIDRGEL